MLLEHLLKLIKRMLEFQRCPKLHERGLLMFKLKNYKTISLRLKQDPDLVLPDALLTSVLNQGEHPLKLLQEQAEREKQSDHAVHDNGTWHGIWPLPSRSEWNARRHHGLLWPRGSHEVDAVQTARKEYKWKDIPKADRPAFHAAAKAGWQVWVDNGAVEVLSKAQADEVRARLKSTGKQSCLLTPRFVYTDKHDGLRTPSKPLPLKANARLVVPGFQDITAYLVRRDAPTGSRTSHHFLLMYTASKRWLLFSADVKSAFLKGENFGPDERELYVSQIRVSSPDEPWRRWTCKSQERHIWFGRLTSTVVSTFEQVSDQAWMGSI